MSPAILRLLEQTAQVQELALMMKPEQCVVPLCNALGSMYSLRHLKVVVGDEATPPQLAPAFAQLQRLTHLMTRNLTPAVAAAFPPSLKHLTIAQDRTPENAVIDISHLFALSVVGALKLGDSQMVLTLPAQPLHMHLHGALELCGVFNITKLNLRDRTQQGARTLLVLPAQSLLNDLTLDIRVTDADQARCAAALGQLTALTHLTLCVSFPPLQHVSNLQRLVSLHIMRSPEQPLADVLQLSKLTGLTSFLFDGVQGLDDVAAVVLAGALTRLQRLHMRGKATQTWAMLPAVGCLTGLHSLCLLPNPSALLTPLLLQQLSSLTGLTSLTLPVQHCSQESQQPAGKDSRTQWDQQ